MNEILFADMKAEPLRERMLGWRDEIDAENARASAAGESNPNIGEDFVEAVGYVEALLPLVERSEVALANIHRGLKAAADPKDLGAQMVISSLESLLADIRKALE